MGYLGPRSATGVTNLVNPLGTGFWVVMFDPNVFRIQVEFEIYHIAISGPSGSAFQVFVDSTFYDYVARGDINSWDPSQPLHLRPGQTLYFYWNTNATPKPMVSVACREPTIF